MTLAQDNFVQGTSPDAVTQDELGALLRGLKNDTILNLLHSHGRGRDFGDLRNFLTLLTFISQNDGGGSVEITDRFAADRARAVSIVRSACMLPDGSLRPDAPEPDANLSSSGLSKDRAIGGQLKTLSSKSQKMLEFNGNLGVLGVVIIGFFAIGVLSICLHFAIIAGRIIYRGRRTCDIPSSLNFMGSSVPGRITLIGIYGCMFAAPKGEDATTHDLKMLTEGTYCQINLQGITMSARVMHDTKDICHLWLSEPLTRAVLRQVLQHSDTPTHYDFTVMRTLHLRGGAFGTSTLPFR